MDEYLVPPYSALLAQRLLSAGVDDAAFTLLLTGGALPCKGSIRQYIAYCSDAPVNLFAGASAHVNVAKRMELVLKLIDVSGLGPQDARSIELLIQVALLKFPVRPGQRNPD